MSQSDSRFTITADGIQMPDSAQVLASVQAYWKAALGDSLNVNPATPQGQIMASEAAIIQEKNKQLLYLAQQFNPATAEGAWQDALAAIYFIERQPAAPTVVQVLCSGLAGTVILGSDTSTSPAQVQTEDGIVLTCQETGTIGADGTVTLPFACVDTGPVEVGIGAVSSIVQAQPGWDTVTNTAAGAVGRNVETRAEFEQRRFQSVALNSRSMLASVYARVGNVSGVIDLLARQNRTDSEVESNGVTLSPHSIYIAVLGGADDEIAEAIYNSVSGGCDYNGTTSVQYTDPVTGAVETVKFQRPETVPFQISVTIQRSAGLSSGAITQAKQNIWNCFYGLPYQAENCDTPARLHIGETVYAGRFYCPVLAAGLSQIVAIELGPKGGNMGVLAELTNAQAPSLDLDDIVIALQED